MNKRRKINKNGKFLLAVVCLVAISGVLLLSVGNNKDNSNNTNSSNITNSGEELYTKDTKCFTVSTSYCDLKYPATWEDEIETKIVNKNSNEYVQFYATLEGKEKIHLFDVVFGNDGYEIGTLEIKDGDFITVNILSHEFKLDKSWSEEEKEKVYMMLEDINYILQYLDSLDEYTSMR